MANVVKRYIVMREWTTDKRVNRVATGPFASRAQAAAYAQRHGRTNYYDSTFYIVLFHPLTVEVTGNAD